MSRVILASNRLPVRIDSSGAAVRTTGGLASALAGARLQRESIWVGWSGHALEDVVDLDAERRAFQKLDVQPVFLDRQDVNGFYEGYSNSTLWPLVHYLASRARFDESWAEAYFRVNRKFAEAILDVAEDGDRIWIHDYHLFPLAGMLRESGRDLTIGFFLHTPFPSSDILRILPERKRVLTGLLGADLIGFHTYNYLRHFRSALLRVLGVESEIDSLWFGDRQVMLRVFPIGHDNAGFSEAMDQHEFRKVLLAHAAVLRGRKLALSVERLDYTKGVPQKLDAIRRYLADRPDKREEVAFVIVAVPSRQGVDEYDQLTEEVQRQVGAINGAYGAVGHAPVQFLHRGFPQVELAALYALADVCLVTPLIDGMNLVAKKFVACQRPDAGFEPGVLVLSEFAGAAQELSQALLVNPYDEAGVAEAIDQALGMDLEERRRRIDGMRPRLLSNDAGTWARRFVDELDGCSSARTGIEMEDVLPVADRLADALERGTRALLVLDYDGTLRPFTRAPEDAVPDEALLGLLDRLGRTQGLHVALVSGRPRSFLEQHFGNIEATLVSEHGYRWRIGGSSIWTLVQGEIDVSWKDAVRPHLEQAVRLTPGSHIEEKHVSLVWHYRRAEPEFGTWRAHGLLSELTEMAANMPVTVHHGNKIVETSSILVSKGTAVEMLVQRWDPAEVLVAGDDQTDETMFALEPSLPFHSIKVGTGSTRARHRTDIPGLRRLLEALDRRVAS
ncbi:hypothetical protein ABI59_00325 [Acidobacteria bacterium Mor1]|nr:hypothetical protein ABI59_00325 [Acidobacteria bacterium Mor1]